MSEIENIEKQIEKLKAKLLSLKIRKKNELAFVENCRERDVYVAYWVDLNDEDLADSEMKILGVYLKKDDAKLACELYEHEGVSDEKNCSYTKIERIKLDRMIPPYLEDN
jgi:hypothetical protein